jgi:CRP/FNR family cyclic AMP-dependent transcriptional regulator
MTNDRRSSSRDSGTGTTDKAIDEEFNLGSVLNGHAGPIAPRIPESRLSAFPPPTLYPPGRALFRQGDPCTRLFYLESGFVKLARLQPSGRETIVGLRGSGWVLGAAAILINEPYVVTAVTATRCTVSHLCVTDFRSLLCSDHAFSDAIHRMHAREIYDQLLQLSEMACRPAKDRVIMCLRRLTKELRGNLGGPPPSLPLKQWELAQLVGVAPQYMCQLLAGLRSENLPKRQRSAPAPNKRPAARICG